MMSYLRRLFTPLGIAAMVLALWLPWARIECREVQAEPDLWQLADVDARLYAPVLLAFLALIGGVACVWRRRTRICLASAAVALLSCATCVYMLAKRHDLARQQLELQAAGGDLGAWVKDLRVETGVGFWLYFAGALVTLGLVVWEASRSAGRADVPSGHERPTPPPASQL